MHGEKHLGNRLLTQGGIDADHGSFDDVGSAPLNGRVKRHALAYRAQAVVRGAKLRQVATTPEHGCREAVDLRLVDLR